MKGEFVLEPTASLVLEMSKPIYENNPLLKKFIASYSLDSGVALVKGCRDISPLCDQVLLNRKYWIFYTTVEKAKSSDEPIQIVLLAGGKTPLSLQCLLSASDKIKNIYEVDITSFEDKKKIYDSLDTSLTEKISFLQYDLTKDDWLKKLVDLGLDKTIPTVFLLEGISYYLKPSVLRNIISSMKGFKQSFVSLDFKYPKEGCYITEKEKNQTEVFELIKQACQLDFITSYTLSDIKELLQGMTSDYHMITMAEVEKKRTNQQKHFLVTDNEIIGFIHFSVSS